MPAPPTGYDPTALLEYYAHYQQVTLSAAQAGYPVGRGMGLDRRFAVAAGEPPLGRRRRRTEIRGSYRWRRVLPSKILTAMFTSFEPPNHRRSGRTIPLRLRVRWLTVRPL